MPNPGWIRGREDISAFEQTPYQDRCKFENTYEIIERAAQEFGDRIALCFLPQGQVGDEPVNVTFSSLFARVNQAANLFHKLGVGRNDVVSVLLPNLPQTHYSIWGAQAVGIVNPINPFLEPQTIRDIMKAAGSKVLVTLSPAQGRDTWEKVVSIADQVPTLECILSVNIADTSSDTNKETLMPTGVNVLDFDLEADKHQPSSLLKKYRPKSQDLAAYFHTGGTTGTPKIACQSHANQIFMAFSMAKMLHIEKSDKVLGGLPLFHVNAIFTAGLANFMFGASVIMLGPDGFRNKACILDFWKIVEKYRATWVSGVPTFYSALLSVPVGDSDISSLRLGVMGAAPASPELFKQFVACSDVRLLEGYGLTEGACLSSINPHDGEKRVGSIGLSIPYQEMKVVELNNEGQIIRNCETDEIGVIVIRGPNVFHGYLLEEANKNVLLEDGWLNTGDLGRCDNAGYFWLTGRAKDLIIRGGHNIDPKMIEDAMACHPAIALVAAVGQPDAYAGELPAVYLTLKPDADVALQELSDFARKNIGERAAIPVHIEILDQMPVTAVGKIFKPQLRCMAIERVLHESFLEAELDVKINVVQDKRQGPIAEIKAQGNEKGIEQVLSHFALAYRFV